MLYQTTHKNYKVVHFFPSLIQRKENEQEMHRSRYKALIQLKK